MNTETEELIERTEVKDTPFTIIRIKAKNESFATLGEYRITEVYEHNKDLEEELKTITWNRIIQVIMILTEKLKTENLEIKTQTK